MLYTFRNKYFKTNFQVGEIQLTRRPGSRLVCWSTALMELRQYLTYYLFYYINPKYRYRLYSGLDIEHQKELFLADFAPIVSGFFDHLVYGSPGRFNTQALGHLHTGRQMDQTSAITPKQFYIFDIIYLQLHSQTVFTVNRPPS